MALTTVPAELANLDGAVTVNESSADVDFRVESNGDANMLFVDGGNDKVGIGTNSPARGPLHVHNSTDDADSNIHLTSNETGSASTDGFTISVSPGGASDGTVALIQRENASMKFFTNGTSRLEISNAGTATFEHPIVTQSGATQGYYIENNAGNAVTPRITNDGNDWTVIRPGVSGGDVAINNFANSHNRVVFRDEGNVEIGDGNLVFASGHGIDFAATSDGSGTDSSELLNDYEEGTWTPTVIAGGSISTNLATYTKIGRTVFYYAYVSVTTPNNTSQFSLGGLPYNALATNYYPAGSIGYVNDKDITGTLGPIVATNSNYVYFQRYDGNGNSVKNNGAFYNSGSSLYLIISGTYEAQ